MLCGTELVRLIVNFRVVFNAWDNREPAGLDIILHGFCRLDHQRMQSPVNGRSRFDKQWTSEVPLGLQHHGVKLACFFDDDEGELSVRGAEEFAILFGKVSKLCCLDAVTFEVLEVGEKDCIVNQLRRTTHPRSSPASQE